VIELGGKSHAPPAIFAGIIRSYQKGFRKMLSVTQPKDKAERYYRLARSITSTQDTKLFEALGAEADQAAADLEAEEPRRRE
jgi:hypothetical protein